MTINAIGIITEFNPFHEGHAYLIEQLRKETGVQQIVCVMSGNFVQRGYPAVFNKWRRSKLALESGVNLVVQLPTPTSVGSAHYFAKGAVALLEAMDLKYIGFGSEIGQLRPLKEAADFLNDNKEKLEEKIKCLVREGFSYPSARQKASEDLGEHLIFQLLSGSNDVLAIEYLRNVKRLIPVVVQRTGKGHHQSATEIRQELLAHDEDLRKLDKRLYLALASKLITASKQELSDFEHAKDGLLIKAQNSLIKANNWEQLVLECKSKRYTYSRISRQLMQFLLGINQDIIDRQPIYGRILGADGKGRELLKEIKQQAKVMADEHKSKNSSENPYMCEVERPVLITNMAKSIKEHARLKEYLDLEIRASQLYSLISGEDMYKNHEMVKQLELI